MYLSMSRHSYVNYRLVPASEITPFPSLKPLASFAPGLLSQLLEREGVYYVSGAIFVFLFKRRRLLQIMLVSLITGSQGAYHGRGSL